jgi:hypothetical protein
MLPTYPVDLKWQMAGVVARSLREQSDGRGPRWGQGVQGGL